jgi:AcrR family transcriptional regulator
MSYMSKEARRKTILVAAMRVALAEGLSAMTVRRVAAEAEIATGQMHHHFSSAGALRAEAFLQLVRESLDTTSLTASASWRERLFDMLGAQDESLEPYIRLWREAQLLSEHDDRIRQAWVHGMALWHAETVNILRKGAAAQAFTLREDPVDIAWRLIALVCGLDGLLTLGLPAMTPQSLTLHLNRVIDAETGMNVAQNV